MAPRRRAPKAAVEAVISADTATFASLPLPLVQRIFLALAVDARGRACCVCRAWRDVLAEPALWTRLDMSGVRVQLRRFLDVLRGASGRSRGLLHKLELSQRELTWDELLPVLTANAGSPRELQVWVVRPRQVDGNRSPTVEAVVAAAPLLQVLTADHVRCTWEEAPRLLRAEAPFALLQMRHGLGVRFDSQDHRVGGMERFGPFAAALADATLQPALLRLCVCNADTAQPALMGALVDAAWARRLRELKLEWCTPPAAAPLARLLAEGSLAVFDIQDVTGPPFGNARLFDAAGAALVEDALRANTTLTTMELDSAQLCVDMRAAGAFLGGLAGHPTLRKLEIVGEIEPQRRAWCCAGRAHRRGRASSARLVLLSQLFRRQRLGADC
jgi:hypothetical protein